MEYKTIYKASKILDNIRNNDYHDSDESYEQLKSFVTNDMLDEFLNSENLNKYSDIIFTYLVGETNDENLESLHRLFYNYPNKFIELFNHNYDHKSVFINTLYDEEKYDLFEGILDYFV